MCLIFKQHCKSLQTSFRNTYVSNSISITGWCQQPSEVRSPLIPSLASVVSPPPTMCEKETLPITCSDHIKLSSIIMHKNHIYGVARLLLALIYSCSFHQASTDAYVAQEWKEQSSLAKLSSHSRKQKYSLQKHQRSLTAAKRNGSKFGWDKKISHTCPDDL